MGSLQLTAEAVSKRERGAPQRKFMSCKPPETGKSPVQRRELVQMVRRGQPHLSFDTLGRMMTSNEPSTS